jgi:hypothetical protein
MLAAMDDRRDRLIEINQRARRAFLVGASEEWQRANGRPPTREELDRLLVRYPGDPLRIEDGRPQPFQKQD